MDVVVKRAQAVLEKHRYLLRYAERKKLGEGDVAAAATALLRRARLFLGLVTTLAAAWLVYIVLLPGADGGRLRHLIWWALLFVPTAFHQARLATSMRTVLAFLAAADSPSAAAPR